MKRIHNIPLVASTLLILGMASPLTWAQDDGVTLDDGQILQIVRTLNDAEIKQAKEALDESESGEVKSVAQMILSDHESSNEQIDKLLDGDIDLDDSAMNETLGKQAEDTHESLQDLDDAAYDCAYLTAQVAQHETALSTAKNHLMPDSRNAGVKQFLAAMEPKLEHHRDMARASMGKLSACK